MIYRKLFIRFGNCEQKPNEDKQNILYDKKTVHYYSAKI